MANSDYFTKVAAPTATTLASPGHSIGGATFNVGSTSGWPTDTGVFFAVDTVSIVNGEQVRDPNSLTVWEGDVTGSTTISNAVLRYGSDQNYPPGSTTRVYIAIHSARENRLIDGLLNTLDQDGTLKSNTVLEANMADNSVDSRAYVDGSIDGEHLSTSAITLGYAQITSNFTTASTTDTDVTGLSTTVTVPSGGRRIKITAFIPHLTNNSGGNVVTLKLKEGTTTYAFTKANAPNAEDTSIGFPIASFVPTAGSHTYKLTMMNSLGTNVSLVASATSPAFILAELI